MTLKELREIAVLKFTESSTRQMLIGSLEMLIQELSNFGLLPAKFWIDGSFLTEKIDPDDIDLVIEIDSDRINSASQRAQEFLSKLGRQELHGSGRKLHTFLMFSAPPGHPDRQNYLSLKKQWREDFGRAFVSKEPKGIAILELKR